MTKNTNTSAAAAAAALNALAALLDAGVGPAAKLEFYDGLQPDDPDVAVPTQNVLVSYDLTDSAFGAASDIAGRSVAASADVPAESNGIANGLPLWGRASDKDGVAVIDGSYGTSSDHDFVGTVPNVVAGEPFRLNSWTIELPQGPSAS